MKAVVYEKYGSPEVLQIQEFNKPSITDDQILVKIHAASIQQTDTNFRSGTPFLARVISGLLKPNNQILGCDYSGTIVAIGNNVDKYTVGDEVYGQLERRTGTHAEYINVSMKEISPKPENTIAVTCGPPIMIHFVDKLLSQLGFQPDQSFVTLEARMHCGIGKCGRCNLGEILVCVDGPVFSMNQIGDMVESFL